MIMRVKILKLIVLVSIITASCNESKNSNQGNKTPYGDIINFESASDNEDENSLTDPEIEFETTNYNFGTVLQGEKIEHEFYFRNTGEKNLLILDTQSSCGCTVSDYDKDAIPPGARSSIKLVFDTKDKLDAQEKKVTIFTNTNPNKYYLSLTGQVVKK